MKTIHLSNSAYPTPYPEELPDDFVIIPDSMGVKKKAEEKGKGV